MMQLKMSPKGEVVIPKKIREQLGLLAGRNILLTVQDKEVVLKPVVQQSIIRKWAERAKEINLKSSEIVHGNDLYEQGEFF